MHPRPGYNLGPRPKHGLGESSLRGKSLGPSGMPRCSPATSGALGQKVSARSDPQGQGHATARSNAVGSPVAHHPPQSAGPPWPRPSLSVLRLPSFPAPEAPSLNRAGRGRYPGRGAKTPRESGGGAAPEGRARALLPQARAAPPQPRPPRHLSCDSCASPSREAASPRPPSSLLLQRLLRLRRTAFATRTRPPLPPIGWARRAPGLATTPIGHLTWIYGFLLVRSDSRRTLPAFFLTWAPPPSSRRPLSGEERTHSRLPNALWQASKNFRPLLCVLSHRAYLIGYCSSNSMFLRRFRRAAAPYTEVSGWCGGNGSRLGAWEMRCCLCCCHNNTVALVMNR